ncbi:MAG: hypothetical protein M3345_02300 [Actinomycetota bacterium]|nr:hypothetical protein [Actinomycetota bacterium]
MGDFLWRLHDAGGSVIRDSHRFGSQEEAEAWMGGAWSELLDEGAESVSLVEGDETLYEMGLRAG